MTIRRLSLGLRGAPLREKARLTPFLLVLIYISGLGLTSLAVLILGAPDNLLLLFMVFTVLVAFNFERRIYLLLLALTIPVSVVLVAQQAPGGVPEALLRVGIAIVAVISIGEYSHWVDLRRRQAEEELLKSEEQYRGLLEDLHDVAYIVDEQGCFKYISPSIKHFSAYTPVEIIGRHYADLFQPTVLPNQEFGDENRLQEHAKQVVVRVTDKDGTTKFVRVSNRPMFEKGKLIGYRGIAVNISDFVAAQTGLEIRQRQLNLLNVITRAALVETQFEAMLQTFTDRLAELFDADGCVITLWDAERHRQLLEVRSHDECCAGLDLQPGESGLHQIVLETGKPVIVEGAHHAPVLHADDAEYLQTQTTLGLPLIAESNWLGAALIIYQARHDITQEELEWAEVVADQVSLAVYKGRVLDQERSQREAANALSAAGIALSATLEVDEVLDRLLPQIQNVVPYERGVIMEIADGFARVVRMWGFDLYYPAEVLQTLATISFEIQSTPNLKRLVETGVPYFIPDVTGDSSWIPIPGFTPLPSWAGVPILANGEVVALYSLESAEVDHFQPEQLHLMTAFAAQASLALQNARLYARAKRQMKESETLRQASSAVVSEIDLEKVLSRILEQLERVIPYDSASIFIAEGERLRILAAQGFEHPEQVIGLEVSRNNPLFGEISRTRQPLILTDAMADPRFSGWAGTSAYVRGWMGVPLVAQGEMIGELTVDSQQVGAYTQQDAHLVMDFATEASIALQHAGLYRQVVTMANRLSILHKASEQVSATLDPQQLYEAIHSAAARVMSTESFIISMRDDIRQDIEIVYRVDRMGRSPVKRLPIESGLSGTIIRTGKPILVNQAINQSEFEDLQFGDAGTVESYLAVPLRRQDGGIFGMVSALSYQTEAYTPDDLKLLGHLAAHAAVALDNTRLFSELQRLVIIDDLTGTFNRRHFFEVARLEFERARRYRRPLTVIMLDIDHFKDVNDRLGHLIGDQVLRVVAQRCRENLRDSDVIGRYSGEEFVLLLPETNIEGARRMAERLKVAIGDIPIFAHHETVLVTISIGIADLGPDCKHLDQLISLADDALLQAKAKRSKALNCQPS
jgi:diguanylate cyclase (GGDEF)-like protein/PAS domain S-box-containing protein